MIYDFDEADPALTLLPMAARRALDAAGLKLSLAGYQTLPHAARVALVEAGAEPRVRPEAVRACIAEARPAAIAEPVATEPAELPGELAAELAPALTSELWSRLSPLDRYVLDKLRRRGKRERLARAFEEIVRLRTQPIAAKLGTNGTGATADPALLDEPLRAKRGAESTLVTEERSFPGPGGRTALRIYKPDASREQRAGIVFFHGGGFVVGGVGSHAALCAALSRAVGAVVVSCDYRHAPNHKFPGAVDDAYFGASFVHEHADELGIDHRRLAVAGVEVGAGLATSVARLAKERRNPPLALQVLIAPVLDLRAEGLQGSQLAAASAEYIRGEADRLDARCSPVLAKNLIGLPPVLIVEAGPAQARAYAARLRDAHVGVQILEAAGADFAEQPEGSEVNRSALRACAAAAAEVLRVR